MAEEEQNPLLVEIRQGVMGKGQVKGTVDQKETPSSAEDTEEIKREMGRIISELKKKMDEIDKITTELDSKRKELEKASPKKTERMLQEIIVPSLDLLK